MFSPGNLRATFDNPNYERLLSHYIGEKYTLRYTGGMARPATTLCWHISPSMALWRCKHRRPFAPDVSDYCIASGCVPGHR